MNDISSQKMGGETQEAFLSRVRKALEHGSTAAPAEPAPSVDESLARLTQPGDDLAAVFSQRAEAVGMNVHRVCRAELATTFKELLNTLNARRVVAGFSEPGESVDLGAVIANAQIDTIDWRSAPGLAPQYDTDAGITDVHAAFAETGTLVCCADAAHSRGLSLVPPVHIAVVRQSDILPDMIDYWPKLKNNSCSAPASSIVFITGPSKTSDIEGVLVTGVHGPGAVHVVLVEDA